MCVTICLIKKFYKADAVLPQIEAEHQLTVGLHALVAAFVLTEPAAAEMENERVLPFSEIRRKVDFLIQNAVGHRIVYRVVQACGIGFNVVRPSGRVQALGGIFTVNVDFAEAETADGQNGVFCFVGGKAFFGDNRLALPAEGQLFCLPEGMRVHFFRHRFTPQFIVICIIPHSGAFGKTSEVLFNIAITRCISYKKVLIYRGINSFFKGVDTMKKIISIFLCAVMLIAAALPFTVYANDEVEIVESSEWDNDIFYGNEGAFYYSVLRSEPSYAIITGYSDNSDEKNIVIPSVIGGKTVRTIGNSFMMYDKTVKSVTIPETVTDIKEGAFYECENLSRIIMKCIPSHIGWNAFINTAYYNNKANWKNGALYLGKSLISGSKAKGAFKVKKGTVTIADGAMCYPIGNKPNKMTSVSVPDSVRYIGQDAFASCKKCKTIKLGKGIRFIGEEAFSDTAYAKQKSNYKNGILYIGKYLIASTKNPETVKIRKGTRLIAECAFYRSEGSKLKTLSLPASVKYINDNAFYNCKRLVSVKLSKSVRKIGDGAFTGCSGIKSFSVDKSNKYYACASGVLFNKKKTVLIAYPAKKASTSYKLPKSVVRIKMNAFGYAKKLKKVELNSKLKYIDVYAFLNCTALKSVTVPKSVKHISFGALGVFEYSDEDGYYYESLKGFTVKGYPSTEAERYAKTTFSNGEDVFGPFRFVALA